MELLGCDLVWLKQYQINRGRTDAGTGMNQTTGKALADRTMALNTDACRDRLRLIVVDAEICIDRLADPIAPQGGQ